MGFITRLKNAWNIFRADEKSRDEVVDNSVFIDYGRSHSHRPDRVSISSTNESSIVMPIYNKIATDVASFEFRHARINDNGMYEKTINSDLHNALSMEANTDQTGRALIQDLVMSLIDEGCVAVVPVDTEFDINTHDSYKIYTLRVGRITQWHPEHVRVEVYNEKLMEKTEVTLPKKNIAIIENPLYHIMNEPNSVLKRLLAKLQLLDVVDNNTASNKLDIIIQLPYIVKSETRKAQAEERRQALEAQMNNSKLGIGYIDGTERVTQLNRPAENNLLSQIQYLAKMLFDQLGISEGVLSGNASEEEMLNYYSRTIEPIVDEIAKEMTRKYLTKTARSQKQRILYFRDPFKLVPISQLADIADKFTRNEILSSNDLRAIIGRLPSKDPKADELRNKNIPEAKQNPTEDPNKHIVNKEVNDDKDQV